MDDQYRSKNDQESNLDQLLDAGLRQYVEAPRAGLEQRMLARLRQEPAPGPVRWWRVDWLPMAAAAALALAFVLAWYGVSRTTSQDRDAQQRTDQQQKHNQVASETPAPGTKPIPAPNPAAKTQVASTSSHHRPAEPPSVAAAGDERSPRSGEVTLASVHPPRPRRGVPMEERPRLSQFPSPSAATAEENALRELARAADPEVVRAYVEPLTFEKLEVKGLQVDPIKFDPVPEAKLPDGIFSNGPQQ